MLLPHQGRKEGRCTREQVTLRLIQSGIMADVKYGLQCERDLFVYVDYVYLECCGWNIVFGIAVENVGPIYGGW